MTKDFLDRFDSWLAEYFSVQQAHENFVEILFNSQKYSLQSGGKRFRPYLCYAVFSLWSSDLNLIKKTCLAIEMIHTYSLIHDDLPSLDNDDYRRGQATNHKVFGDDIALLAGDALLTEAFGLIANDDNLKPEIRLRLIQTLSEKIGPRGMVGGQVLDMKSDEKINIEKLQKIHLLKTSHLIEFSALAATYIAEIDSEAIKKISQFGLNLGLAFQIKDDLLDAKDFQQDYKSYVSVLGLEQTNNQLQQKSDQALQALSEIQPQPEKIHLLKKLISANLERTA